VIQKLTQHNHVTSLYKHKNSVKITILLELFSTTDIHRKLKFSRGFKSKHNELRSKP